ncbi:hypothetical protein Micbo1qcDRAFT_158303 [Microdochium bolleyi]|uniref:Uncharacterized protein n=1 Tax=Microdochium bolleyi TaxID=196109 RepID=A0A136JG44_9PEZI|nr:hypothetical protein Micbo1qcDRAFT_158303 [Microdochium bolleyi]
MQILILLLLLLLLPHSYSDDGDGEADDEALPRLDDEDSGRSGLGRGPANKGLGMGSPGLWAACRVTPRPEWWLWW